MPLVDPFPAEIERAVARSAGLWQELRGASLFMTGGTGLFGRWLTQSLVAANRHFDLDLHLYLLSRDPKAFAAQAPHVADDKAVTLLAGDIANFEFPAAPIDYVLHGATTSAAETFHGETPLRKFDTLVQGTRRVLDLAARGGVRRLLFLSSGVAYGEPAADIVHIPESFTGAPDTCDAASGLGQAKRAAEYLCAEYAHRHDFDFTIARCFSFVGPFLPLRLHYAAGNFIQQALEDEAIVVHGDGTQLRSYLYLGDLVTWLVTLLVRRGSHRLYNVGSDRAYSIRELAQLVRDELAPQKPVRVLGQPAYSVGNVPRSRYLPDIERARAEFSLDAWTGLPEAVRLTAAHAQWLAETAR